MFFYPGVIVPVLFEGFCLLPLCLYSPAMFRLRRRLKTCLRLSGLRMEMPGVMERTARTWTAGFCRPWLRTTRRKTSTTRRPLAWVIIIQLFYKVPFKVAVQHIKNSKDNRLGVYRRATPQTVSIISQLGRIYIYIALFMPKNIHFTVLKMKASLKLFSTRICCRFRRTRDHRGPQQQSA